MTEMIEKKKSSSLSLRVKSAVILAPIIIFILVYGGIPFAALMVFSAVVSIREWSGMIIQKDAPKFLMISLSVMMAVSMVVGYLISEPQIVFALLCLMGGIFAFLNKVIWKGHSSVRLVFGLVYIGFSISTMIWLRLSLDMGLYYTLMLLFIVWGSDSCAYFTGRLMGGPKLAPKISPNKTWSGFMGSSVGAGAIAALMACPDLLAYFNVVPVEGLTASVLFCVGFFLGMFGQAGDLFISLLKRHYGVKDTGNLIPGHGGILDRIDALLLVAPIFAMVVMLFV